MDFKFKRIIWAIDVFESKENHEKVLSLLKAIVSKTNSEVELVHILNFAYVPPNTSNEPSWGEALQVLADKRMKELSDTSSLPGIKTKVILVDDAGSVRESVRLLLEYAKKVSADAILVPTHARSGVPRLLLGSFAETLLLKSQVPVLTINPDARAIQKVSRILFPTYFTQHSHQSFQIVLAMAKKMGSHLVLYYKEPLVFTGSYVMPPGVYSYLEKELKARKEISATWKAQAEQLGVSTTVVLDEVPGNAAYAISEYATNNEIDLVAMVTRADKASTILFGSATRQVVRHAQCPVFAMRESV